MQTTPDHPARTIDTGLGLRGLLVRASLAPVLFALQSFASSPPASSEKTIEPAQIILRGFAAGCAVYLDADPVGKTSAQGELSLTKVAPGDHYLHVDCAGQPTQAFFVSPKPAGRLEIAPAPTAVERSALEAAESRQELTRLVQKAVQARTAGHQEEAIADLRRATQLDPENPDLHRELGITFLLLKDWERARVEYLEAIRHDPSEAESHNGLGYALEKLGAIEAASKEFHIAMQLEPDDKTYQEHYTETILALQDQKEKGRKK
jgi:tetratricopeptide (TPR) repeat protein